MYSIYKLTLPNGKIYIGLSSQEDLADRWQNGRGYHENRKLYQDIFQYGWLNIQKEILETVENKKKAYERESYYIQKFSSVDEGYNKYKQLPDNKKKLIHNITKDEYYRTAVSAGQAYKCSDSAIHYAIKNHTPCKGCYWERIVVDKSDLPSFFDFSL